MFLCIIAQNVNFFPIPGCTGKKKKSQVPLCVLNSVRGMFINISSITSHNSL